MSDILSQYLRYSQQQKMRVSKHKKQNSLNPVKSTFQPQPILTQLIKQYISLRAAIQKLLNITLTNTYSISQILTFCRKMPKSLQRNKHLQNQLQLSHQIQEMLHNFTQPISKHRYKPYKLYISFQYFSEIITNRLRLGINSHLQTVRNNSQTLSLLHFTKELQHINILIQQWAKLNLTQKTFHNPQTPISFIFQHQQNSKFHHTTQPSTAQASRNFSRHQKTSTLQEFPQKMPDYLPFKSTAAKIDRKQLKIATRCPSAADLLVKSSYKQPSFEMKRSYKKLKYNSNHSQLMNTSTFNLKQNTKPFRTSKNSIGQISFENLATQNYMKGKNQGQSQKQRKISILNKGFKNTAQQSQHQIRFRQSKITKNLENHKAKNMGGEAQLKKKKWAARLSNHQNQAQAKQLKPEQQQQKQQQQQQKQTEKQIAKQNMSNSHRNSTTNIKQSRYSQNMSEISRQSVSALNIVKNQPIARRQSETSIKFYNNSDKTPKDSQQLIRISRRQRKIKRPGKMLSKFKDQIHYLNMLNIPKKSNHFYQRRKTLLTNRSEQQQLKKQLQTLQVDIQNSAHQAAIQKKIDFEQDVLLAVSDALKKSQKTVSNTALQKDTQQVHQKSVNSLYGEINQFLRNYEIGLLYPQPSNSVFFEDQERVRHFQDQMIRQKMQIMMKHNQNSMSNIFELYCKEINNKDEIYNQVHRQLSFCSDSEWIRNTHSNQRRLIQKQI